MSQNDLERFKATLLEPGTAHMADIPLEVAIRSNLWMTHWPSPANGPFGRALHAVPAADLAGMYFVAVSPDAGPGRPTSVRIPELLHDVAHRLVAMGAADSFSALLVDGLRCRIADAAAHGLQANTASDALEAHYLEFPDERPTTAEIAHAEAQIVGHPASGRPDLIELAVEALGHDAYVEEILAWASGSLDAERRLTGAGHTT